MAGKWKKTELGRLLLFANGHSSPSRAKGLPYPVYGSNGIIGYANEVNADADSIIIGRVGSYCGSLYLSKERCWVTDNAIRATACDGNNPRFLFYLLGALNLNNWRAGSGQPLLNQNILSRIPASVPDYDEQRAIAHILGALDDKIECNRRINVTLEKMAMALYKHWFIDFGPFKNGKFVDSVLGRIPDGWEIRSLYDSADYINGAAFKNHDFSTDDSGLPVIKISELKNGITPQTKFCNKDLDRKYKITCGDILFSWSGQPETSIDIFLWTGTDAWLNQHTFKVISHDEEQKCFVFFLLKHLKPNFIEIARNKQTTGLGHVTTRDMQRMKIVFPSRATLEKFNENVQPLFSQILENKKEEQTLTLTRDYLLPKLLSGEIKITDAERCAQKTL